MFGKNILSKFKNGLLQSVAGTSVGISIGSSAIKIVELKKINKGFRLLHFGVAQLPDDSIINREMVNPVAVVETLRNLLGQLKLQNKQVATSVSGSGVFLKQISIEAHGKKEIADQVLWEAEQYLPIPIQEMAIDYFPVSSKQGKSKTNLVVVGVKKSLIEGTSQILRHAGLNPTIIDLDVFALQQAFESNYPVEPHEAVLLIDIGAYGLKAIIIHQGKPVFYRDIALGGRNLTQEIQRQLKLNYFDAEVLKTSQNHFSLPQEVSELMAIMNQNIVIEVQKILEAYQALTQTDQIGPPVAYSLLSGGTARLPLLSKTIEDNLRIPCQILQPFNSISYDPSVFTPEYIQAISSIAAIPVGLALREEN